MRDNKTVQLAYRVTPERRRELKQWAIDHETTFQDMVENALELLLNPVAGSPEKKPKQFTSERIDSVHNYPIDHWMKWAEMVLASDNEDAAPGLAANIRQFLSGLAADIDLEKGTALHAASSRNIPDYAEEVGSARLALQQLRAYFEAKRKTLRRASPKITP